MAKANTFEGGADTVEITTGNSGGTSGDVWDVVSQNAAGTFPQFSTDQAAHGAVSGQIVAATTDFCYLRWHSLGQLADSYGRCWVYFTSYPSVLFDLVQLSTDTTTPLAWIEIDTDGTVRAANNNHSASDISTTAVNLNGWTRIEWHYQQASLLTVRIATNPDGAHDEELSQALTVASPQDRGLYGCASDADGALDFYIDDIYDGQTGWFASSLELSNTFEGGSDETDISTANSGGVSGDAFTAVTVGAGNTLKYDNAQKMRGALSCRMFLDTTAGTTFLNWTQDSLATTFGRFYVRVEDLPTIEVRLLRLRNGATAQGYVTMNSAGKIRLLNAAGTAVAIQAGVCSADTWYRVEYSFTQAGASGSGEVRIYLGHSTTPIETLGPVTDNFGSLNYDQAHHGQSSSSAQSTARTIWFDDLVAGATTWAGPSPEPSVYYSAVLADSPVAYYRMDESSGQPQDSSGNGNHTTVTVGTPTYSQPSLIGSDAGNTAILLDAASNEHFTAPDHTSLDVGDVFSLECWVQRGTPTGTYEALLCKDNPAFVLFFSFGADNGLIVFDKRGVSTLAKSTVAVLDTDVHHIVATKNGADVHIYLDGVDVTGTVTNATLTNTASPLFIGAREDGLVTLNGVIDEVAVYPTALSAARVLAHYEAGVTVARPPISALSGLGF